MLRFTSPHLARLGLIHKLSALMALSLSLSIASCDGFKGRRDREGDQLTRPPHGGGYVTDTQGVSHTLFTPLALLSTSGDTLEVSTLAEGARWVGVELWAARDSELKLKLSSSPQEHLQVVLYGPRSAEGLWAEPIKLGSFDEESELEFEVRRAGFYFALAWGIDEAMSEGERLTLHWELDCEGCEVSCEPLEVSACDLYCAEGYQSPSRTDSSCRVCACEERLCGEVMCQPGEVCEGERCVPSCEASCPPVFMPVCGAGQVTYPSACLAACEGVEVLSEGPCLEPRPCDEEGRCPLRSVCDEGLCRRVMCDCPPEREPVCSEAGQTFPNLCELSCVGATLADDEPCEDEDEPSDKRER